MEGTAELFTGFAERIAREKGTQREKTDQSKNPRR